MSNLKIVQFPYGADNYGVLLHDADTGDTAAIDAGDADAYGAALDAQGWSLSQIWITHHHADHTAGLTAMKQKTRCHVIGPEPLSKPIEGVDTEVSDGSVFQFADREIAVLHTPGHTLDMVNYYMADDKLVFTGDTSFSMGCGRLFEGDATMMLKSFQKLAALPDDTLVYCSHEYTATNARFALDVDPDNDLVRKRSDEVTRRRQSGEPTVPVALSLEKQTNPFLRTADAGLQSALGLAGDDEVAVFAALRERRNQY